MGIHTSRMTAYIALALAFLAMGQPVLRAEEQDAGYTDDHINGNYWKGLDFNDKLHYLYGMIDGVTAIAECKPVFDEAHNFSQKVSESILKATGRFYVPGGTYEDIIQFVDGYYSKAGNMTVPVYEVYSRYLAGQKGWTALDKWNESVGRLRRQSGRN